MILFHETIFRRFIAAFPKFYINQNYEAIIYPKRNIYFPLKEGQTETELKASVLEFLSREAAKSDNRLSQKYHLDGINAFLGTSFSQDDMEKIYTYLGNGVNHAKTMRFIESGYDLEELTKEIEI